MYVLHVLLHQGLNGQSLYNKSENFTNDFAQEVDQSMVSLMAADDFCSLVKMRLLEIQTRKKELPIGDFVVCETNSSSVNSSTSL